MLLAQKARISKTDYLPIFELSVLFCNFGPVFSASGATSGDPEALHAPPRPSVEGHNMGLDT